MNLVFMHAPYPIWSNIYIKTHINVAGHYNHHPQLVWKMLKDRFHACPIIISSCWLSSPILKAHSMQCPQITPRGPVSESQVYMTQRDMSSVGVPTIHMWSTMLMNSLYNRSIYLQDWLSSPNIYIYMVYLIYRNLVSPRERTRLIKIIDFFII
jgi:hypothetical protein